MIAMQYVIRLAGDYDSELVHERVTRRKPLFDGLEGLIHKAYLFNGPQAVYAPFYVWRNDDAARAFLTGDLFRDVVDTFGRPRVRMWNVLAYDGQPAAEPQIAVKELDNIAAEDSLADIARQEMRRHNTALTTPGLCFHLVGFDADRWELMRYSAWSESSMVQNCDADVVETYDVLYLSKAECAA